MKTILKRTLAATAFLASFATAYGQTISYDGIFSAADGYSSTEIVKWFNGHDDTTFGDFNTQKYNTFIRYGVGTQAGDPSGTKYFFLFAESPLEAKNMVWGAGMNAMEIAQYGKLLDFSAATGSEKISLLNSSGSAVVVADIGSNVSGKGKNTLGFGMIGFKDSVDYLIGNGISNTTTSSARTYTMSVEMKFALDPVKNAQVVAAARNGLDFHLSPDRGLIPQLVPEPSTTLLFGLLSTIGLFRRKR